MFPTCSDLVFLENEDVTKRLHRGVKCSERLNSDCQLSRFSKSSFFFSLARLKIRKINNTIITIMLIP